MNVREKSIEAAIYIGIFCLCFMIITVIAILIQHAWISFFEYGSEWNENTMPPLIWWSIIGRVLPLSLLIGIITAVPVYVVVLYLLKK